MALGIYIAIVIIAILAVIMIKLIRNTSKTSYFGQLNKCKICGRKTHDTSCPNCKYDSKSLR